MSVQSCLRRWADRVRVNACADLDDLSEAEWVLEHPDDLSEAGRIEAARSAERAASVGVGRFVRRWIVQRPEVGAGVVEDAHVSFDVFFQRFVDGGTRTGGNVEARRVLEAYLVPVAEGDGTLLLHTRDGSAELYGLDQRDGFMATHIGGRMSWDLLVEAARQASFAIMPVGRPVCVPTIELADHLPAELVEDAGVVVVATGADLLAVIGEA